jgi:nucleoside 2-deoxyribosyltransferase
VSRGTVYLGGPITGLTWDDAAAWRSHAAHELFRSGWKYLDPMRGEAEQFGFTSTDILPSTFAGDGEAHARDLFDIDRATVGLFNFTGSERASLGSACEIGYAYARGLYIVSVVPEGNVHDHLFVNGLSGAVRSSLDDALGLLRGL